MTYSKLNKPAIVIAATIPFLGLGLGIYMALGGVNTSFAWALLAVGYLAMFPLLGAVHVLCVNADKLRWVVEKRGFNADVPAGRALAFNIPTIAVWSIFLILFIAEIMRVPVYDSEGGWNDIAMGAGMGWQVLFYIGLAFAQARRQNVLHRKVRATVPKDRPQSWTGWAI
jgi:hypothetical protein